MCYYRTLVVDDGGYLRFSIRWSLNLNFSFVCVGFMIALTHDEFEIMVFYSMISKPVENVLQKDKGYGICACLKNASKDTEVVRQELQEVSPRK